MKKILSLMVALFIACSASVLAEVHYRTLEKVNEPKDIKEFSIKQMESLAKDIRGAILNKTNLCGGHVGPDLGIVEVTIAMHYVFDSPTDKFIFDTSHQCYPHKMLTGRKDAFIDPLNHKDITGFSNFHESPHDFFIMGHTSTSVTLASGMAKARDLKGEKYNVIALIGDGSLSGGEALEGLNNAAVLGSNIIIIVNDNEMCIAENHGGLYKNLKELRDTNGTTPNNMFTALGYDYYYVSDGHNLQGLIDMFKKVKDTNKPTVVHIHTIKGKGYIPAMQNKEKYHWITPGFMDKKPEVAENPPETYTKLTVDYIMNKAQADKTFVAVSPATPGICGLFSEERQKLGKNYTDVGIAEQHAVGYVSGIAKNGGKPVLIVHSSFLQRAYDQLSQDLAINNSPAVILVVCHGISSGDVTHNGVFDIPLISNIPNIVYMSPTNKEEYIAILDWAVKQNKYPVAIRVPQGEVVSSGKFDSTDYSKLNKFKVASEGSDIAIIAEGDFFELGKKVQALVKEKLNIDATLINPVYLTGVDYDLLERLKQNHTLVITLEDGVLDGGFGEKISRFYSASDMKVLNYGAKKEFTDRVPVEELYKKYHLEPELILTDIVEVKEMSDKGVNPEGVNEGVNPEGVNNTPEPEKAAPEVKTEVKEEAKPEAKEVSSEEKNEVKPEEKPIVKDEVKQEPKQEVKTEKSEAKSEPKKVEMPEIKPAEPQSDKPAQKKKQKRSKK